MKILSFTDNETWLEARKTRITGSRLKDVLTLRGNTKKKGYYELIAERMALPPTDENAMDRGHRLEPEALQKFSEEIGKEIKHELVMWVRDDNDSIAISPDGDISDTEAVEVKCLSSASHIEALLTQKVPNEYTYQVYQYFIVKDTLETLYVVFYNPQLIAKQLHHIVIQRSEIQKDIDTYLEEQKKILAEVEDIVNQLTF